MTAQVPPDLVVCRRCMAELQSADDRRHEYAFTSCTDCGPRYSIIEQMPYERAQTSMGSFRLCDRCRAEYKAPSDRRFHAQTNACPDCGPQIWLRDSRGCLCARKEQAIRAAATAIRDGRIVAVRGLGGYQLVVDATLQEAVERLRQRKQRRGKPLAVMVPSLAEAMQLAQLDDAERQLLSEPAGPIVVVAARSGSELAPAVTSGLHTVGLMLPTTPLHWLLLDAVERPIVCTSANVEGDPLAYDKDSADGELGGVADCWLEHDRPIQRPIDDSVVRLMAGRSTAIRLARGYAPLPLDVRTEQPLIALGGHQKTSVALSNGAQAVLGPHIGDLDTVAARERFVGQIKQLSELYGIDGPRLVCDQHPDYFTTQWAAEHAHDVVQVQHHHAHIVAGMLEHGWLDRQVLGVAFDGTGYGTDGNHLGRRVLADHGNRLSSGSDTCGPLPCPAASALCASRGAWQRRLVRDAGW